MLSPTSVTEVLELRRLVAALQRENALLRAAAPARELAACAGEGPENCCQEVAVSWGRSHCTGAALAEGQRSQKSFDTNWYQIGVHIFHWRELAHAILTLLEVPKHLLNPYQLRVSNSRGIVHRFLRPRYTIVYPEVPIRRDSKERRRSKDCLGDYDNLDCKESKPRPSVSSGPAAHVDEMRGGTHGVPHDSF